MKVFLQTWGCRANHYDTEAVRGLLAAAGVEEAQSAAEAEFAICNTCTVTASAEADMRAGVRRASRENPDIRTIVMGCAAALPGRDEKSLPLASLPGVVSVVPGSDLAAIGAALGIEHDLSLAGTPGRAQLNARANLRIQDGCDEHCTFCATTIARGANTSRPVEDIVVEAAGLAKSHPEIVITGIHIGTYGRDIGSSLGELMESLIERVGIVRFRLSSVEATEVDDRLADLYMRAPSRLVPHLHAPLQSGSDTILRRMGRSWYDSSAYESAVRRLTDVLPVFGLSADVIAGFPGESDADHLETMRLVGRLPFTALHVFPWSPRPGTAATRLKERVPGSVARRRAAEIRRLAADKASAYARSRDGGACDVVVTERGRGLTEDYLSVSVADAAIPRRSRFSGVIRSSGSELTVHTS